ncbi:hypothetical protein LTR05_003758 [Lithohypha guttulata]|uniref:peptidyl-tRNA hydrolase n=1 Tax=Lithohypha guttulata TaxID=1690604 RepID=A0AAN7Y770_9EURO|nr:hypothetical protein LTR05_003758 [Lithohypha guttulata]
MDKVSPSLTAIAIASGIIGLVTGYFLGQGSSIGLFSSSSNSSTTPKKSWPNSYDVKVHVDSSDEELLADDEQDTPDSENEGDGKELKSFDDRNEEVKLVLGVRTDLAMGKGKIAAQCSHATLACYKYLVGKTAGQGMLKRWERGGQAKIAVQVKSEEELETLQALAIAAGSATVLGVLGPKSVVDQVTGHLKLL